MEFSVAHEVHVGKRGALLIVHGPTKMRVSHVAYRIFLKTQANVYTMKGSHIAFNPIKQKERANSKKK